MSSYAIGTQTNSGSLAAQRHLQRSTGAIHGSVGRMSSGLRVRSASDGTASMAVSENVRAQLGGFQRAAKNINDTVSMANTAESGYQAISDILVKMKQVAVESASDGVTDTERGYLATEFTAMADEIDRLVEVLEFNGNTLLDGTAGSAGTGNVTVQAGMRNSADDQLELTLNAVDSVSLGVNSTQANVADITSAQTAVGDIDTAMESLNTSRMNIGSFINRADIATDFVQASVEQFSLGLGNARDASIGEESATFTKEQVLQQAGVSMLSQSNAQANIALRLIS